MGKEKFDRSKPHVNSTAFLHLPEGPLRWMVTAANAIEKVVDLIITGTVQCAGPAPSMLRTSFRTQQTCHQEPEL